MAKFIEVTDANDSSKVFINIEHIVHVKAGVPSAMEKAHHADGGAYIYTMAIRAGSDSNSSMSIILQSEETYEEVKSLIAQAY